MDLDTFSDLYLNVGDKIKINFTANVFVKDDGKYVDVSYDVPQEGEWVAHGYFTGMYCGENYKQPDFSLDIVKLRLHTPVRIAGYLSIPAEIISTIEVLEPTKPNALDMISHKISDIIPRKKSDNVTSPDTA